MNNKHWWKNEIIYQIYPKSFFDSNNDGIGDIAGITQKLPYLKKLGITMIWVCPIYRSPMIDNGYDISDYYHVDPLYGDDNDLTILIDTANAMDIKIILDLVVNHTSDEHEWFKQAINDPNSQYRNYYIFKDPIDDKAPNNWRSIFGGSVWEKANDGTKQYYYHTFDKKQPDLNWENKALRQEIYQMINHWLDKGIAGFRVDAITFIKKDQGYQSIEPDGNDGLAKCTRISRNAPGIGEFLHELKANTFDKYHCVTIGEAPGVKDDQLATFIGEDGYFSMIFDFRYADFDVKSGSEWFYRKEWTIADYKKLVFTSQIALEKAGWGVSYLENHDQPRSTSKLFGELNNYQTNTALATLLLTLRGTPIVYQGEEIGMTNAIWHSADEFNDISSIDQIARAQIEGFSAEEALALVAKRSRDNSRTPFQWSDDINGGFSIHKPWLKINDNYLQINSKNQEEGTSTLNFYRHLISIRKQNEALIFGHFIPLKSHDDVIAFERNYQKNKVCVFINMSPIEHEITLEGTHGEVIADNYENTDITNVMTLQAHQALVIKYEL